MGGVGRFEDGHFRYESARYSDDWREQLYVPGWDGPTPTMVEALAAVQNDLEAAGLRDVSLVYQVTGFTGDGPLVNVLWDGGGTNDGVDLEAPDLAEAILDVAQLVAQGLIESKGVYWPSCRAHARRCRATLAVGERAIWLCEQRGRAPHVLADIGHLATETRGGADRLWLTLHELAAP